MPGDQPLPAEPAATRRRTRQRTQLEEVHVRVPVAFNRHLGCGDAAFVLIEVLRNVLFMRGQIPMPVHELLSALNERERRDNAAKREKAAAATAAAAAAALRASTNFSEAKSGGGKSRDSRTALVGRNRGQRSKSRRPLAKAPAHRRARKLVGVLEEITSAVEEAFADAASKGRPVLEALILLGASHLSPREVYSVMFTEFLSGGSSESGDVRGKSGLADAYARKLVRSTVGAMSSVNLRGVGPCRVHLFLRIADARTRDPCNSAIPATPTPHLSPCQDLDLCHQPTALSRNLLAGVRASGLGTETAVSREDCATSATENDFQIENASSTSRIAKITSSDRTTDDLTCTGPPPNLTVGCQYSLPSGTVTSARSGAAIARLSPRPRFKIRVSRSRPAPKVSIVISKRPSAPPSVTNEPRRSGTSTAGSSAPREEREEGQHEQRIHSKSHVKDGAGWRREVIQDGRARRRDVQQMAEGAQRLENDGPEEERAKQQQQQQQQQQQRGVWHQLVSARLVGLKGCNSLAG